MQDIIQHILVLARAGRVYVSPTGSRGASAGFFILLSADIAAMAPGTHAGAASPLMAVGGYPINVDETLKKKIMNDATAFLRSYCRKARPQRGARGNGGDRRQGVHRRRSAATASSSI